MKRFITVLSSLLVLPAFAEVAPVYYDEIVEYTDEMLDEEEVAPEAAQDAVQTKNVTQRNTINRSTSATRAVSAATSSGTSRTNASSRAIAASPRSTTGSARGTASRTTRTNTVVNRSSANNSRASVTSRNAQGGKPVTARIGTNNNSVMPGNYANSYSEQQILNDSGASLYNPNNAATVSRIGARSNRVSARARISSSSLTSATTPVITEEDVSTTTTNLTAIAELTDYCKAQYAACMDNYCNVLDDNQGRCSCSKNLKNYAKTEAALAKATEDFQEAVQKIKYIGLTGSQIEALFAETEAELAMKSNSDSSRLKTSLDAIKKKVVDVSSPTSTAYDATSGVSLDMNGLLNADFSGGFDLNAFLGTGNNNTSSVSNQRGEQLYKTATNRCKTAVLNSCTAQGIDANVITNSYDLEIDKQCIAYERSLNEANTEMKNNVINATNILQQARLLLTQNKNSYDLRGCVAAIDSCMQDEYVCGSDYELCLDPTGKYLANGEIVKGGTPGVSGGQNKNTADYDPNSATWTSKGMYDLYATWNYGSNKDMNAWSIGAKENLGGYIDAALSEWKDHYTEYKDSTKTENMALYLLQKVGYIDGDDKVHGMCASVMKQCQDYTFNSQRSSKKYIAANEVVRQYLTNTLAKIKVQQDALLADYAEGCRADVQSCLSTNGYDESNTSSTTSRTAVNACSSEITTCMSVGGYTPKDGTKLTLRAMNDWVSSMLISCPANYYLYDDGIGDGKLHDSSASGKTGVAISCTMCPRVEVVTAEYDDEEGEYIYTGTGVFKQTLSAGGQARTCNCPEGYEDFYEDPTKQFDEDTGALLLQCVKSSSN
jgi:hypothetical protein